MTAILVYPIHVSRTGRDAALKAARSVFPDASIEPAAGSYAAIVTRVPRDGPHDEEHNRAFRLAMDAMAPFVAGWHE